MPLPPVLSDTVQTESAIDLRLIADLTDVSVPEIVALNPSLLRTTTPRDMTFDLHIPPGTRDGPLERSKPASAERRRSSSWPQPVRATRTTPGRDSSRRLRRATSWPSRPGLPMIWKRAKQSPPANAIIAGNFASVTIR